jgi:hypothetical protein
MPTPCNIPTRTGDLQAGLAAQAELLGALDGLAAGRDAGSRPCAGETAGNQTKGTATAALASPGARSTATWLLKTQLAHRMPNLIQHDLLRHGADVMAAER